MSKFYLPIGCQCSSAQVLASLGLRQAAMPFDWASSSPKAILYFLEEISRVPLDSGEDEETQLECMRQHFVEPLLIGDSTVMRSESGRLVHNRFPHVVFPHELDLLPKAETQQQMINKYTRRALKMRRCLRDSEKVVLLWIGPPNKEEQLVKHILRTPIDKIILGLQKIQNFIEGQRNRARDRVEVFLVEQIPMGIDPKQLPAGFSHAEVGRQKNLA